MSDISAYLPGESNEAVEAQRPTTNYGQIFSQSLKSQRARIELESYAHFDIT